MRDVLDRHGYLWPTPAQEQLLKAALGTDAAAIGHFHAWRDMIDLDSDFDRGSFRLLPLLYATLSQLELSDSLMGRLKGTYRRAWCEAQPRFEQARDVLSLLHRHGIETMMTKGVPLAISYYRNETLRPMADLDIVVPRAQARDAITALEQAGWVSGPLTRDNDLEFHHARQFFHPKGGEVDLHWHVLLECRSAKTNQEFWDRAEPLVVRGVTTRQLDPTDMLLHTVVHGVRWNAEPPIRWIADAAMILRGADQRIDWDRLIRLAKDEKLSYRFGLGLHFLAVRYAMPIPSRVLEAIDRIPITLLERIENTIALRDTHDLYGDPLTKNWVIFARYCRIQQASNPLQFINGLSHFVRVQWALAGRSEIPAAILRGLLRRLRRQPSSDGRTYTL